MLLKKLEIQGFKSFVDRTELLFEPGISAIVGPNGCGKSNISDAIRWVLGEQSAKALRGAAMVDVIFNGTESRKPSGMAEVSLTISNEDRQLPTDFAEVTVTRRSYRSGESEYLLNKTPCRLKDIYAIFTDTGVGTDGYSLLEQGKMDLILSSKPADRRAVFEEAAGITKYKDQRDEALRKLESTDQNLLRVNDIVTEVKRQIGSLERQARKAEKYKVLKAELDGLQGRLLLGEFHEASAKREELTAALVQVKEEAESLEAGAKAKEGELSGLHLGLLQDEESLARAAAVVHALEGELSQLDRKIEINRTLIANLAERRDRAEKEGRTLREREVLSGQALSAVQSETGANAGLLEGLRNELQSLEQALNEKAARRQDLSAQAQTVQQQILDLINQRTHLRGEADSLQGKLIMVEQHTQGLRQELSVLQESLHQASLKLEEAATLAGGKQAEVKDLEGRMGGRTLRRLDLEGALSAADEALSGTLAGLASLQSRLSVLEELSRVLSGYEAGPRALLLGRDSDPGLAALKLESLAQKVRTRPEFELAVELALGHNLQTLLCATPEEAGQAVEWLRSKNQGRASLLIGSLVSQGETHAFAPDLLAEPGVKGPLSNFLEAEASLAPVLQWLAGSTLLIEDSPTAWRLRHRLPAWAQAVTLQGEILTSQGLLTGGSVETPERGLLGREREIIQLKSSLADLSLQAEQRRSDRDRLKQELTELSQEILQASTELQGIQIVAAQLEKERSAKAQEQERLQAESASKRQAIEEADQQAAGQRAKSAELEESLATLSGREAGLKEELGSALDGTDRLRAEETALQSSLGEKRVEQASKKERQESLLAEERRLHLDLSSLAEQAAGRESEVVHVQSEVTRLQEENAAMEVQLKEVFSRRDSAQDGVKRAAEAKQERQGLAGSLEDSLKELRRRLHECQELRHQREMAMQELQLSLGRLKDTLSVEFHVDLENVPEPSLEFEPGTDPRQRVAELREKVQELGAVNPAAAEEYQELEQRLGILTTQLDDLSRAKADLHKVITKINQTTRERFLQTFEAVQLNFQETFKQLFKGGEARLILQDDGDLLEAGIEIIARPPGKRQQSVSLLSGGEKALTAIALLFALFRLKPSPFCLLDEIDAPLDDANIGRFSSILTEYAQRSQFIVITHSKLTMEKADVMYGITMEESGVSRIISAKFKDDRPVVMA